MPIVKTIAFLQLLTRHQKGNILTGSFQAKVIDIRKIASDKAILLLDLNLPLVYKAGQYVELMVPNYDARFYSIANAPIAKKPYLEIHIKDNGWGGLGAYTMKEMSVGDTINLKGPLGSCFWKEGGSNKVIMIAGGMGITQIKALLEEAMAVNSDREIYLYWGVEQESDAYLRKELEKLFQKKSNKHMALIVGKSVKEKILQQHPDLKNNEIYLSGPPPMISALVPEFLEKGAELSRIHTDNKKILDEIIQEIL